MSSVINKRWLCVDPGETTGWSIWQGERVIGEGQTPLWEFAFDLHDALNNDIGPLAPGAVGCLRPGIDPCENQPLADNPFDLIVCEKFALYPWKAKDLAFDEFRTVQLIGAITFMSTLFGIELHKQPATIKEPAMEAGAGELFISPLRENRHSNDSIMHGVFYMAVECNTR